MIKHILFFLDFMLILLFIIDVIIYNVILILVIIVYIFSNFNNFNIENYLNRTYHFDINQQQYFLYYQNQQLIQKHFLEMWECCDISQLKQKDSHQQNQSILNIFLSKNKKEQQIQINTDNNKTPKLMKSHPEQNGKNQTGMVNQNYFETLNNLKKEKKNYIDIYFKHTLKSITSRPIALDIQWKGIVQLKKNLKVNQDQNLRKSFVEFRHENHSLKHVIQLLIQKKINNLNPTNLIQIEQGIYSFQLKYKGKPTNVVIDDYLPTYKNRLIYSQPIKGDFYVPLLQKALAKVYGNFESIPHDEAELFNVISCLPYINYPIKMLKSLTFQKLREILQNKHHLCISKSDIFMGTINSDFFHLDSKLKNHVFLKRNIEDTQIFKVPFLQYLQNFKFLHVWIIEKKFNSIYIDTQFAEQLYKLEVTQINSEFIVTYQNDQQCQNQLLVVNQNYNFEDSSTVIYSKHNSIYRTLSQTGTYYLHTLTNKNSGVISIHSLAPFKINKDQQHFNFLQNFFHKCSLQNSQTNKYLDKEKRSFIATRMLYGKLGMAYIEIFLDKRYPNKIKLQFNNDQIKKCRYMTLEPFNEQVYVKRMLKGDSMTIIKFLINAKSKKSIKFPPPITIEQIFFE